MRFVVIYLIGVIFGTGIVDLGHGQPGQGHELLRRRGHLGPQPRLRDGRRAGRHLHRLPLVFGRERPLFEAGSTCRPRATSTPA
jgi:hypothetical protein